jgi:hypothetical protein
MRRVSSFATEILTADGYLSRRLVRAATGHSLRV